MRRWNAVLILSWLLFLPAVASAAELSFTVDTPNYPTPLVAAILGLSLTAIAVIGSRACNRSSDMMMYMVLASIALTAVMVTYSHKLHGNFQRAGIARLAEFEREAAKPK